MKRKRSSNRGTKAAKKSRTIEKCIVHNPAVKSPGNFTSFSSMNVSEQSQLQKINDFKAKRLMCDRDSPLRMAALCDKIPEDLPVDLYLSVYHQGCYKAFCRNYNRLAKEERSNSVKN